MPKPTEEQKLEARLMRRFRKATREFGLLHDGDSILIGLSGGKDSIFLVEAMGRQMRISKPKIKVHALHIRMSNIKYESDTKYLEEFCRSWGVELHVVETGFDMTTDNRKAPCFLCSWTELFLLFVSAQFGILSYVCLFFHAEGAYYRYGHFLHPEPCGHGGEVSLEYLVH